MNFSRTMGVPHRSHGSPVRPYERNNLSKYPDSPLTSTYRASKDVPPWVIASDITSRAVSNNSTALRWLRREHGVSG